MSFNYVDGLIALLLLLFVTARARRGLFLVTADVTTLVLSVLAAFRFYPLAAGMLESWFAVPESYAMALGFLIALVLAQLVLGLVARLLLRAIPVTWHRAPASRLLAIAPTLVYGVLLVAVLLLLVYVLPVRVDVQRDVEESRIGGVLLDGALTAERAFAGVFGEAIHDTLSLLEIPRTPTESVPITVSPETLSVDEAAEAEMRDLVNRERTAHGLQPLEHDPSLVPVARTHSRDMWRRGYFSHVDPDGDDPFDRMREGAVRFRQAGENLALARTTALAHRGLMNSPAHRRNILRPAFTRIGVGVVDGEPYGKMYTQLFAD